MLDGILHQVDKHLFDENDVHWDHEQHVGRSDADLNCRIMPIEFHSGSAEDLLARLQLFFDI